MKSIISILILSLFFLSGNHVMAKQKDLSGPIAVHGILTEAYQGYPVGTPVTIRKVVKRDKKTQGLKGIIYAVDINNVQYPLMDDQIQMIDFSTPTDETEFWQQVYIRNDMYKYFDRYGYKSQLRQDIEDECLDYLNQIQEISYDDDYITSYVQSVFAKLFNTAIDSNRKEVLNIRVIQSPDPDAYMLPNGSILISTGLLSILDSEAELAGIIANELGHFALDHQAYNIYRTERRAKRTVFWNNFLAAAAEVSSEIGFWYNNSNANLTAAATSIGAIAAALSAPVIDRFGMNYTEDQETQADIISCQLLQFKGYGPDGLVSALSKIADYYNNSQRFKGITRYESVERIQKRIQNCKCNPNANLKDRPYLRATSSVVTFNAAMNANNQHYENAIKLVQKNMDNGLATDNDYVILVKAQMALNNTAEINNQCLIWLDKAELLAGSNPNLDVTKQRILLLMRMNRQVKASDELRVYIDLLTAYKEQGLEGEELEWINKEIDWSVQLLHKISRI